MTQSAGEAARASHDVVLEVDDLTVEFPTDDGLVQAVRGVSYQLRRGEVLGIVGESGSGKSVTSMAVMGLLPRTGADHGLGAGCDGQELVGAQGSELYDDLRGDRIAMIFQDPMTSLNPVYTVGYQIAEAVQRAPRRQQGRGPRAGRSSCSRSVAHPEPGAARRQLPARAVGRHAAARRHRDRDGQRPGRDHRRRADHGPGRHRAGAGAGGARRPPARRPAPRWC